MNGAIPDMTASTESYVQLQSVYKEQAAQDLAELKVLCPKVSEHDVTSFCANVFLVEQLTTRSIVDESTNPPDEETVDDLKMAFMDPYEVPVHTPLLWFLGLRACMVFHQEQGRYPGTPATSNGNWEADLPGLLACYQKVAALYKLEGEALVQEHAEDICHEYCRFGNAEIHNIASVVGGVASQEAVKSITGQYIPLNHTYVFNGIACVAGVYKL